LLQFSCAVGRSLRTGSPARSDTTYLAVVDKDGNIASVIQSLYDAFGSGRRRQRDGIHSSRSRRIVHTRSESSQRARARKRPFHTIIPAFMERGDTTSVFGIMGGSNQPLAHAQFVSNFVDYQMNIQSALEAPDSRIAGTAEPIAVTC